MKTTDTNHTPIQLKLPVDMARIIKINDPVYSFSEVMAHIDLHKYFVEKEHETEGIFGSIKWNKGYKRLRRRGIEGVILELSLISCGFNLYKYHLKKMAQQKAA